MALVRIKVKKGFEFAFIDKSGNEVFGRFDYLYPFQDGLALTLKNGIYKLIDRNGKESLQSVTSAYKIIGRYGSGLIPFQQDDLWGFVDLNRVVKIPPKWIGLTGDEKGFVDGLCFVRIDPGMGHAEDIQWTAIDVFGEEVMIFNTGVLLTITKDGLIRTKFTREGPYIYIDLKGNQYLKRKVYVSDNSSRNSSVSYGPPPPMYKYNPPSPQSRTLSPR
ncbi:WG repeat-containing protein [Rhodoflexus sp.]